MGDQEVKQDPSIVELGKKIDKPVAPLLIELTGETEGLWQERRLPFFSRLKKKCAAILSMKVSGRGTVKQEIDGSIDRIFGNINALLDRQKISNAEKQAEIALKLANIRKTEAETRKINAEAELTESELSEKNLRRRAVEIQHAQSVLSQLMEDGYLTITEYEGRKIVALVKDPDTE